MNDQKKIDHYYLNKLEFKIKSSLDTPLKTEFYQNRTRDVNLGFLINRVINRTGIDFFNTLNINLSVYEQRRQLMLALTQAKMGFLHLLCVIRWKKSSLGLKSHDIDINLFLKRINHTHSLELFMISKSIIKS